MGSVNNNFLPASTGLTLGASNQRWGVFAETLNATTIQSASVNIALTGTIALAASDFIAWRNNANAADVHLTNSAATGNYPADVLTWNGGGIAGTFISDNGPSPAVAGKIRLSDADTVNFRNHTNSADVVALTHNSDDSLTVGGAAGIQVASLNSTGGTVTASTVQPSGTAATALNLLGGAGTTTGGGIFVNGQNGTTTGGNVSVSAGGGTGAGGNGGTLFLNGGTGNGTGAGGGVTISGGQNGGAGGNVAINGGVGTSTTGTLQSNTYVAKYNNVATTGQGLAPQYATIDLTAQAAAITTATLYAVPATGAGQYRISWNAQVTTVDAVSSTLGALTIGFTSADGTAHTITCGAQTSAGAIATTSTTNTTAAVLLGVSLLVNCKASTNITYAMAYTSNTPGAMKYDLRIKVEYLG